MDKFGFIGCGNMGGTLCEAVSKAGGIEIFVSDSDPSKAELIAEKTSASATDNKTIAKTCRFIFLGVKPQVLPAVLNDLSDTLRNRKSGFVLVTMAAGTDIESVNKMAGGEYPVIRIMPNTPAAAESGMILYCRNALVTDGEMRLFLSSASRAGRFDALDESLIDAASAVSGCGPAFVYMFIEAMADGAVKCGLPRDKAIEYAAQTVIGSGKMVLESGRHPGELKDSVCSPAGSTIAGVSALEGSAFRGAVTSAVCAAYERTKELGKK